MAHLSSRTRFRLIGSTPCSAANSRHRNFANILRHLIAPLHGGAPGDNRVPALHVRIGIEIDSLPFVARDPWPDGDVGDGVVIGDEFVLGEPAVEHAVEPMRLFEVAVLRAFFTARSGKQKGYRLKKSFRAMVNETITNVWEGEWRDAETGAAMRGFGVEVWIMRDGKIAVWEGAFNTGRADQTNSIADLLR